MRIEKRMNKGIDGIRTASFDQGQTDAIGTMTFPVKNHARRFWVRPAGVIAGGTAIVVSALLLLTPSKAVGIEEIRQALRSVPASYSRSFRVNGKIFYENWQEGTKRRYRYSGQIDRGYNGKLVWYTQPKNRYAVLSSAAPDGFGFDGTDIEHELKSHEWQTVGKPELSRRIVQIQGETLVEVTIQSKRKESPEVIQKSVLLCRESDNLPVRIDNYRTQQGRETKIGYRIIEYPNDIPDSVFDPHVPAGFHLLDEKAAIDQMVARLSNPEFRKTIGDNSVTLLGIFTDRLSGSIQFGSVNVLFTSSAPPHIDSLAGLLNEAGDGFQGELTLESDDRNKPRNHGMTRPSQKLDPQQKGPKLVKPRAFHGMSTEMPQDIRPLFFMRGNPVYCIRYLTDDNAWRTSQRFSVILPVSKPAQDRILRVGSKGIYVRGHSKPVGKAEFKDSSIPVLFLYNLVRELDPNYLGSSTSLPIESINVKVKTIQIISKTHPK